MLRTLAGLFLSLSLVAGPVALGGCAGSATVVATAPAPRLVWIGDGIWVVEDYPYAVYYYDGFYWRLIDGVWYRSDWYTDGWTRVTIAPQLIVRVHRPSVYVHYRAPRGVKTRTIEKRASNVRDHRKATPKVRDHRAPPSSNKRDHRPR